MTMPLRIMLSLLVVAGMLGAGTIDIRNAPLFENFEGGVHQATVLTPGTWTGTLFQVISGTIDHIKDDAVPPNPYALMCRNGTSCIDTAGAGLPRVGGEIQTIDDLYFEPGEYILRFDLQGWRDFNGLTRVATIQVILPGLFDASDNLTFTRDGAAPSLYPRVELIFTVNAPLTTRLTFKDVSVAGAPGVSSFAGAILDDVVLKSTVPEPQTMGLLLLGLTGIAIGVAKRRSAD
jgi:hypothetical protein